MTIDDMTADEFEREVEQHQAPHHAFWVQVRRDIYDRLVRERKERGERLKERDRLVDRVVLMEERLTKSEKDCDSLAAQLAEAKAEVERWEKTAENTSICQGCGEDKGDCVCN